MWYLFVILTQYNLQEGESLCCTENAIFPLRSIFPGAYAPVHKYSDRAKHATPQMLAVPSIQAHTRRVLGRAPHEHYEFVDLRHQLLQPSIGCAITSGLVASSGRCPCQLIERRHGKDHRVSTENVCDMAETLQLYFQYHAV